ncbi:MAG: zf-HC2 domain-containing protein [Anaerolineales bacterium]|nr:zf-HC2 domain-containing protein [Anaerolineales bacterium]
MHLNEATLNEYLDDALETVERSAADAHLATCPQCAARLAEMHALFAALDALPAEPLTRDLSASVLAALTPAPTPLSLPIRAVLALQAIIAIIVLAVSAPLLLANIPALNPAQLLPAFTFDWASLFEPLNQLWAQSQTLVRSATSPLAEVSVWMWGAALSGLAVLWLVGNGAVLRLISSSRSHSWKN